MKVLRIQYSLILQDDMDADMIAVHQRGKTIQNEGIEIVAGLPLPRGQSKKLVPKTSGNTGITRGKVKLPCSCPQQSAYLSFNYL